VGLAEGTRRGDEAIWHTKFAVLATVISRHLLVALWGCPACRGFEKPTDGLDEVQRPPSRRFRPGRECRRGGWWSAWCLPFLRARRHDLGVGLAAGETPRAGQMVQPPELGVPRPATRSPIPGTQSSPSGTARPERTARCIRLIAPSSENAVAAVLLGESPVVGSGGRGGHLSQCDSAYVPTGTTAFPITEEPTRRAKPQAAFGTVANLNPRDPPGRRPTPINKKPHRCVAPVGLWRAFTVFFTPLSPPFPFFCIPATRTRRQQEPVPHQP
jgi:hypothetical protein